MTRIIFRRNVIFWNTILDIPSLLPESEGRLWNGHWEEGYFVAIENTEIEK